MMGMIVFSIVFVVVFIGIYYTYCNWVYTESLNLSSVALPEATPEPLDTEAPFSNAPVKGPSKLWVIPQKWEDYIKEDEGVYTMSAEPVVRWDLIPVSARVVTLGFRMSNPPITDKQTDFKHHVLTSVPASAGVAISFEGRSKYKLDLGKDQNMLYVRDDSLWEPNVERVEVRLTQTGPTSTRIEIIYNGADKVISSEQHIPVSQIKAWPQKTKIFDPRKIQNVWVTYNK
jgi:hypothetical protein